MKEWFYNEYVSKGLESGFVVPTRQYVVEGGLGKVQGVLDLMITRGCVGA